MRLSLRAFDLGGSRRHLLGRGTKPWIPPPEGGFPVSIQDPRADLQQEMRPSWGPGHVLACAAALAHHLIHGRFDNTGAEGPDLARVVPEAETAGRPSGATACRRPGGSCAPVLTAIGTPRLSVDTAANM